MKTGSPIPDVIFQWLEEKPYDSLKEQDQQTVRTFLSREEYDDMHLAMRMMIPKKNAQRKNAVMEAFDSQHGIRVRHLSVSWVWKAAAVVLPAGLMACLYFLKQSGNLGGLATVSLTDTVYVSKEIVGPKEITHDTVYLIKYRNASIRKPRPATRNTGTFARTVAKSGDDAAAVEQLRGLTLRELRSISDDKKGSSLEDDTLWMSFEAVSL